MSNLRARMLLVVAVTLFAACAPAASTSGALGGIVFFVGLAALLVPGRRVVPSAHAGAPLYCQGYETKYCTPEGVVAKHCCPEGAKCNYRDEPWVDCGHGLCSTGGDVGQCAAPEPRLAEQTNKADCDRGSGGWTKVCANKVVKEACLPPLPTNYSGEGFNPSFTACGVGSRLVSDTPAVGDRCTTHRLVEDCYPTRAQLGEAACAGAWTKVCLGGKVSERCLPTNPFAQAPREWEAAAYVACPDGSCAVGEPAELVCRKPRK